MHQSQLKQLRQAFLNIACAELSCYPDHYDKKDKKSPLDGHCALVAFLVKKLYGGDLIKGKISGNPHYWNRLPNGKEIDLTSCQFGGDGLTPLAKGRKVKKVPEMTPIVYLIAYMRLLEELKNDVFKENCST